MKDGTVEYDTDVLVLGSGLAGLRAAIEAKKATCDVILVDKSFLARMSNSMYAGLIGSGAILEGPPPRHEYSLEHTFEHMAAEGVDPGWDYPYLENEKLMMVIAVEMVERQTELRDYGVQIPAGDRYSVGPSSGYRILMPLLQTAIRMGVKPMATTFLFDLIKKGDRVIGAVGFDVYKGEFVVIRAKSTIIATGGYQKIFKRTDSTHRMTGDGQAMAYRAGCPLWEMEVWGVDMVGMDEPGLPLWWLSGGGREFGCYRNGKGEDYMAKYFKENNLLGPNATLSLDDPMAKRYDWPGLQSSKKYPCHQYIVDNLIHFWTAAAKEVYEGRGDRGCVYFDYTKCTEEQMGSNLLNLLRDFDWKHKWVHIYPFIMATTGGVDHDEDLRTPVKGLYAAGEAGQGFAMHHANVTGARAGRYASMDALWAAPEPRLGPEDYAWIEDKKKMLQEILDRKPTPEGDPKEIKRLIGEIVWGYCGPLKTGEGIEKGLKELDKIRKENLPKLYAPNSIRLRDAVEVINMVLVAEAAMRSALARTETRGTHKRIDYPKRDDKNWLKNVLVKEENGKMKVYTRPLPLLWVRPEPGEDVTDPRSMI